MTAASGRDVAELRVDGGASVMDLLCQMQADQLQVPVERPAATETTALGAAYLAGLAEGVWSSTDELSALWSVEASWGPQVPKELADALSRAVAQRGGAQPSLGDGSPYNYWATTVAE